MEPGFAAEAGGMIECFHGYFLKIPPTLLVLAPAKEQALNEWAKKTVSSKPRGNGRSPKAIPRIKLLTLVNDGCFRYRRQRLKRMQMDR